MTEKICYLGDDSLDRAASYLSGIMRHYGLEFDYVPSGQSPPASFTFERYAAYVVSDYPAQRFGDVAMGHVAACVEEGSGLVMIGGWESFHGQLGEYQASPLAAVLPVVMQSRDDRQNCCQPCLIQKVADHPALDNLPWEQPPAIGGFNRFKPKPQAQTVLAAVQFDVRCWGEEFEFAEGERSPLLVVGQHGQGRTAALATDVAPHWVGGLVDWGDSRITQQAAGGMIEVGNWYAQFFRNLIAWAGNLD